MNELTGLVICGGESSRMGEDKSLIQYYNMPQRYYIYHQLKKYCKNVYISFHPRQMHNMDAQYESIFDQEEFINSGPITALLSAHQEFPQRSFLIIGCDYPFFTEREVQHLFQSRDTDFVATIIYNEKDLTPEPLLGIYETAILEKLMVSFNKGQMSLRKVLLEGNVKYIQPLQLESIKSIDNPEDYQLALKKIHTFE